MYVFLLSACKIKCIVYNVCIMFMYNVCINTACMSEYTYIYIIYTYMYILYIEHFICILCMHTNMYAHTHNTHTYTRARANAHVHTHTHTVEYIVCTSMYSIYTPIWMHLSVFISA